MTLAFGEFQFDPERLALYRGGRQVALSRSRLQLLRTLLERPGASVTKEQLMHAVWGQDVNEGRLTVAIADLRKALGSKRADSRITTLPKVGYYFAGEVTRVGAEPARPTSVSAGQPLYVGRARVAEKLEQALARALTGHGGFVPLVGEPGMGKTRAVEELERALPSGVRSAWGCCSESGDTPPLWPWQELLEGVQAHAPATHVSAPLAWLGAAARGPDTTRDAAFGRAATQLLATVGDDGGWLLVLDDLHRADAASLELLLRVLDRIAGARVLLVATLRAQPTDESVRHTALLAQVIEHPACQSVALQPLSLADVSAFVAAQLADAGAALARAVHERSEGNPFFMTELVRRLSDEGTPDAARTLQLPQAALDLMRQRVQAVDAETQGVLSACAVIGRTLPLDLAAEVLGEDPARLRDRLDEAVRCDVLGQLDQSQLRFSHELLRCVLYDAIPPAPRRQWHARVASALDRRRRQGAPIAASELAFHGHAALPAGDLHLTIRACREAADEAASLLGATDVAHYTWYALEALRLLERPSQRLRMSLLYGVGIYSRPYDTAAYARCVRELIDLALQSKSGEMLARGGALLHAHPRLVPLPADAAPIAHALSWLPTEAHGLRALAIASQAVAAPHCFDAAACLPRIRQAGELVEAAMREMTPPSARAPAATTREVLRANTRGRAAFYTALLHQLYLESGDPRRAQQLCARLSELGQRSPAELSTLSIDLAFHRAALALCEGALEPAQEALQAASAQARALSHAELLWHSERALTLLRIERGEPDAHAALRALHKRAAALALLGAEAFIALDRAVHLERGRLAPETESHLRSALSRRPEDTPALWAMKLSGLVAAGLLDDARAALTVVPAARLRQLPHDGDYLGTLGHVARAAIALDAADYYAALEELLLPHQGSLSMQLFGGGAGWVAHVLGLLSAAAGRHEQASERLQRALERHGDGLPVRGVELRLDLARSLHALTGSRPRGQAALVADAAYVEAQRLGLEQFLRSAQELRKPVRRAGRR